MLMQSLNEALLERRVDAVYATLMVLLWEPRLNRLTMSNAGAEPLLICRNGKVLQAKSEGVPIGLLEHQQYEETTHEVEHGDLLLLFSDGVEDQLNASDDHFGRTRIHRLLERHAGETPFQVVNQIFTDLDEYRGGTGITDDQTVVAMKVMG